MTIIDSTKSPLPASAISALRKNWNPLTNWTSFLIKTYVVPNLPLCDTDEFSLDIIHALCGMYATLLFTVIIDASTIKRTPGISEIIVHLPMYAITARLPDREVYQSAAALSESFWADPDQPQLGRTRISNGGHFGRPSRNQPLLTLIRLLLVVAELHASWLICQQFNG